MDWILFWTLGLLEHLAVLIMPSEMEVAPSISGDWIYTTVSRTAPLQEHCWSGANKNNTTTNVKAATGRWSMCIIVHCILSNCIDNCIERATRQRSSFPLRFLLLLLLLRLHSWLAGWCEAHVCRGIEPHKTLIRPKHVCPRGHPITVAPTFSHP